MKLRALAIGAITAAFLAVPTIAMAAWGQVTGNVNLRTGPSTSYAKITTMPAGARVFVNGSAGNGWLSVRYGNVSGYVSGSYVATGYANNPPPRPRPGYFRPAPPRFGYWHRPYWDNRHHAWYDGRRWYHNGVWYNDPSGFSLGFSFGR
jgi:uncharacterized protein YraI